MKSRGSATAWIISAGIIIGILCFTRLQHGSITIANPGLLPVVLALHVMTLFIMGHRWQVLLDRLGAGLPYGRTMHIYLASRLAAVMAPSFAAEAAAVGLYRRFTNLSYGQLTGSLLLQKFTSLLALAAACLLCLALPGDTGLPAAPYAVLLVVGLLVAALASAAPGGGAGDTAGSGRMTDARPDLLPGARGWMGAVREQGAEALRTSRQLLNSREAPRLLAASAVIWALYPLKVYVVTLSLDLDVSFMVLAASAYVACITGMIPLLPGGLGSFEAGMAFMLTRGGLTVGEGLMVAVLLRAGTFWLPMLISAVAAAYMGVGMWGAQAQPAALQDSGD